MKKIIKNFFIPHHDNNYHPHILHTKRAVLYSLLFLTAKAIVVLFAILLPTQVFLLPDILAGQARQIDELSRAVRTDKGLSVLQTNDKLNKSATLRALDMAGNGYFSHTGPNKHTLSYFLNRAGYKYSVGGENLAMGFSDARSIVNAWIKSPTHYANLIDPDYNATGIDMEVGNYDGNQTVFAVQHFGASPEDDVKNVKAVVGVKEKNQYFANKIFSNSTAPSINSTSTLVADVKGQKTTLNNLVVLEEASSTVGMIALDSEASRLYWIEQNGKTVLRAKAQIFGTIEKAVVYVSNYPIELKPAGSENNFEGVLTVPETADVFFNPVIIPTLIITVSGNKQIATTLDWYNVKPVNIGSFEKYSRAKQALSPLTSLFEVSRGIYIGFTIFFVSALLVSIFVEIRKQHYHIIVQTLAMVGLLVILWWA